MSHGDSVILLRNDRRHQLATQIIKIEEKRNQIWTGYFIVAKEGRNS